VPEWFDDLSDAQNAAVAHRGGPLLIVGGAGSGKTHTLAARFAALVATGTAPERIVVLTPGLRAADGLRSRIEATLAHAWEELWVTTAPLLCLRLLREESLAAGLDPFTAAVGPSDRLALLNDHFEELGLRVHDFQGAPAVLLASFVERIDRLKAEGITATDYSAWAAEREGEAGRHEREFASVFATHDRLLLKAATLDHGELVLRTLELLSGPSAAAERMRARFDHVLIDEFQDATYAQRQLVAALASPDGGLSAAGDDDQALSRARAAGAANLRELIDGGAHVVSLEQSFRCPARVVDAARAVVAPLADRVEPPLAGREGGEVAFWRCTNERAQAQGVAADIERLITRDGVPPERIAVLVRSVRREGQAVAVALEERAVPARVTGAGAFFQRTEIRDLLAWLRLLANPADAPAVVRALARPPVELRSVDLARCTQIARRRKLDMVSGLAAATESPQIPPEARERILGFLRLYRSASAALDTTRPDLFVHRLIDRLGLRRQQLFAATADVAERLVSLARFGELAAAYVRREPQATPREFATYIAAVAEAGLREDEPAPPGGTASAVQVLGMREVRDREFDHVYVLGLHAARMPGARGRAVDPIPDALLREPLPPDDREAHVAEMRRLLHASMTRTRKRLVLAHAEHDAAGARQPASPFAEEARAAVHGAWEARGEELFGPAEALHATFRAMREELLTGVARTGSSLRELRLDTDLDVDHAVVRYLELVKLAAVLERPVEQPLADALAAVNAQLGAAVTSRQREILLTSMLDDALLEGERERRARAQVVAARTEPSLAGFLPRSGDGLALSATDIYTYRTCPLRYKFARVFKIPQEPTTAQRFGILVHNVLQRYHESGGHSRDELIGLLDAGWRRSGLGSGEEHNQLRGKAVTALDRYYERSAQDPGEPEWFERAFSFKLGPHLLRGRVDRVDKRPDGGYELIDYKTGRPKTAAQLSDDVQLSIYAMGAQESWELETASLAYWYVLDDEKVLVERDADDREWITDTVLEVADGILGQGFEPTPSYAACSTCDFRIACPAAEK
jgi:DNA helicase-2/ATP-dependent DNA helicase PcrA